MSYIVKVTSPKIRRAAVAGLATLAVGFTAAGCSAINPQATTFDYSPSDGVQGEVGDIQLTNLMIVTQDENAPGRYLGTIVNRGDSSETVEIEVNNQTVSWDLEPDEFLRLEDDENETGINRVGTIPGELADAVVTAGGESIDLRVSVLNGTLPEYRPFVPGEVDEDEVTEHLYDFEGPYSPDYGGH